MSLRPSDVAIALRHCLAKKKPTRQNTLRYSIASAYLLTSPSAWVELLSIEFSDVAGRGCFASTFATVQILPDSIRIAIRA